MNRSDRRTGRLAHDPARLAAIPTLGRYVGALKAGRVVDWTRDVAPAAWGMYANDRLSDCTAAAVGHAIGTWQSYVPPMTFLTDLEVIALYAATGGYRLGEPATDRGALCLDVLEHWTRVPVGGGTIGAFCAIDPGNAGHVRLAIEVFGGVYAGVTLRQSQIDGPGPWDVTNDPVVAGHCVWVAAADDAGLTGISWGGKQRMTWGFWNAAADECYALLSPNWLRAGRTPEGFPAALLMADLRALAAARG